MNLQVLRDALPEIVTQLLGFLIVFYILKRFAFASILGMIDARRQKIAREFEAIEDEKKKLDGLEKEYKKELEHIEQVARAKIQEAANVGLALARDIQEKARADAQQTVERAKDEIDQELKKARLSMRDQIVDLSALMTERIIQEKLEPKDHQRLVDKFIKEIESLS